MVSLQSTDLHFITHSTSGVYDHKVWEIGLTEGKASWHPPNKWIPIPNMAELTTEPVVCKSDGEIYVFGLDLDGRLKYNRYNSTTEQWRPEGAFTLGKDSEKWLSKPATVALPFPTYLWLVILGEDRALYNAACNGGDNWTTLEKIDKESKIKFLQPPVVASWNFGRRDVFGVAIDGKLYHAFWARHYDRSTDSWRNFEDLSDGLPVSITNQVQVITRKQSRFDLLVVGTDCKVYHRSGTNDTWGEWKEVPEAQFCRGVPELVSFDEKRVDAFVVGHDGYVRHLKLEYEGEDIEKKTWTLVDNKVAGPTNFDRPTAVSREKGKIDLAVVHTWKGGIQHRWYSQASEQWEPPITAPDEYPEHINGSVQSRVGTAS